MGKRQLCELAAKRSLRVSQSYPSLGVAISLSCFGGDATQAEQMKALHYRCGQKPVFALDRGSPIRKQLLFRISVEGLVRMKGTPRF